MSMLIILGALFWIAAMTVVAAMCLMAARADAVDELVDAGPVAVVPPLEAPRFARPL